MSVRLRLEPAAVENLLDFFRRRGCPAVRLSDDTIQVELPHDLHDEQARMEVDLYLRVWQSLHEWTPVHVLE